MKFKRVDLLALILFVFPFIYWFLQGDAIPERIPVHWGFDGEPNQWSDRSDLPYLFLLMGLLAVGIYVLFRMIYKMDPKKTSHLSQAIFDKIGLAVVALMSAVSFIILHASTHPIKITNAMYFVISLLFAFMGNVMYNVKPNYFVGFRLPWTLENEYNWTHTHRLAGKLWFGGGLILAVMALVISSAIFHYAFVVIIIVLTAIPAAFSYCLFKKGNGISTGNNQ